MLINVCVEYVFIIIRIVNCIVIFCGFDFSCNRVGVRFGFIRKFMN